MFSEHGLRVEEKTEVMWLRLRRKALQLHLDEKKIKQTGSFVYLCGLCGDGNSDTEIRGRMTARLMLGGKAKR